MGLFGNALGTILGGASKPSVPKWTDITLPGSQTAAINANTSSLPGIENLATQTNTFNQGQITDMLNKIIPGWSKTAADTSASIASLVRGEIPTDVSQAVQSSAAARALTGGFGGSGLAGNLTARDLAGTSRDLMMLGISSEESWTKLIDQLYAPGEFNISSMFITPQQEFQATLQNNEQAWNAKWLQNQVNAMPDPQWQAIGSAIGGVADIGASLLTANMFGAGGGGMTGGTVTQNASPAAMSWFAGASQPPGGGGAIGPWGAPF